MVFARSAWGPEYLHQLPSEHTAAHRVQKEVNGKTRHIQSTGVVLCYTQGSVWRIYNIWPLEFPHYKVHQNWHVKYYVGWGDKDEHDGKLCAFIIAGRCLLPVLVSLRTFHVTCGQSTQLPPLSRQLGHFDNDEHVKTGDDENWYDAKCGHLHNIRDDKLHLVFHQDDTGSVRVVYTHVQHVIRRYYHGNHSQLYKTSHACTLNCTQLFESDRSVDSNKAFDSEAENEAGGVVREDIQ